MVSRGVKRRIRLGVWYWVFAKLGYFHDVAICYLEGVHTTLVPFLVFACLSYILSGEGRLAKG